MRGEGGQAARREHRVFLLASYWDVTRQPDSLLDVLKYARAPVWQSSFQYEPVALWRAQAHEMRGDLVSARAEYDTALALADSAIRKYPDDFAPHAARGRALAGLGRRAEALAEEPKIRANFLFKDRWVRETMLLDIALIHGTLGDADGAVRVLDEILQEKYTHVTVHMLRLYPDWDRVREHPKFQALLAKYANHPNVRS
jgi:tetratricopeptide (TPR) repeat protein